MLQFAAGFLADLHRVAQMAIAGDVMRGAAIGPRDQAAEMQGVAFKRGVAGDRRFARAIERGEERPFA